MLAVVKDLRGDVAGHALLYARDVAAGLASESEKARDCLKV